MNRPLEGIRVVEVAAWAFVPSAGAVLADWGATVIKVEPLTGDPLRGLMVGGILPPDASKINFMVEIMNRGKRSVSLDLGTEAGKAVLMRLIDSADVFLTSFLPQACEKFGITAELVQQRNPRTIYARGSGWGNHGTEAGKGGYDAASFAGRGGVADAVSGPGNLPVQPRPAYGDIMSGLTLAGGVSAALVQRDSTGEAPVVDVSLLGTAVWNLAPDVSAAKLYEGIERISFEPGVYPNPVAGSYETADGRFLTLVLLESQRFWADLCTRLERPDLIDDARFSGMLERYLNCAECCAELAKIFASKPLDKWKQALEGFEGVWSAVATAAEVANDPQVRVNGYVQEVQTNLGTFTNVANPVQFNDSQPVLEAAPQTGEHTDEVLLELGFEMDEILEMKISGALL